MEESNFARSLLQETQGFANDLTTIQAEITALDSDIKELLIQEKTTNIQFIERTAALSMEQLSEKYLYLLIASVFFVILTSYLKK